MKPGVREWYNCPNMFVVVGVCTYYNNIYTHMKSRLSVVQYNCSLGTSTLVFFLEEFVTCMRKFSPYYQPYLELEADVILDLNHGFRYSLIYSIEQAYK